VPETTGIPSSSSPGVPATTGYSSSSSWAPGNYRVFQGYPGPNAAKGLEAGCLWPWPYATSRSSSRSRSGWQGLQQSFPTSLLAVDRVSGQQCLLAGPERQGKRCCTGLSWPGPHSSASALPPRLRLAPGLGGYFHARHVAGRCVGASPRERAAHNSLAPGTLLPFGLPQSTLSPPTLRAQARTLDFHRVSLLLHSKSSGSVVDSAPLRDLSAAIRGLLPDGGSPCWWPRPAGGLCCRDGTLQRPRDV